MIGIHRHQLRWYNAFRSEISSPDRMLVAVISTTLAHHITILVCSLSSSCQQLLLCGEQSHIYVFEQLAETVDKLLDVHCEVLRLD